MVGPFQGADRYVGPGAYSEEEEVFAGVPIPANVRNASFIGKGKTVLDVQGQAQSRIASSYVDSLGRTGVREVTAAGSNIGVDNFQQLIPFYEKTTSVGNGTLASKILLTRNEESLVQESYEFEVVTVGGAGVGQYRVKTLSTGAVTTVQTVIATYGNDTLIPGAVFRVSDTLGTSVGDKAVVTVRTDYRDGDFLLVNDNTASSLDWSLYSGSSYFAGSIGIPVKIDPTGAATVAALARNINYVAIDDGEVVPVGFNPIALDSATYTATCLTSSTYQVVKTKDGVDTVVTALDVSAGTFTSVLTEATVYVFDGISLNMSVTTPSVDGIKFTTQKALFSSPTNGVSEMGLAANVLAIPRENASVTNDSYRIRVHKSDVEGLGSYVIIPESSGVTSNEILTSKTVSTTLLAGLNLRIAKTTAKLTTDLNLVLNSSFVDGPLSAPVNWNLGGGASIDTTQANVPYGERALKLTESTVLTGATGNLFQFDEVLVASAFVLFVSVKRGSGSLTGGLTGVINWYNVDNSSAGSTTIILNTAATTSWSRIELSVGDDEIPVGAVKGTLTLYNTDPAINFWINAIQLELTAQTAYRESDIVTIKTATNEVPDSPSLVLEKGELSPSYSVIDTGVEVSLLSSQSTVRDSWYIKVLTTTSYEVVRKSTGDSQTCAVGVAYTGNVIPGVLLQVKNNFSSTDVNDVLHVRTLAKFNKTKTIDPVPYYVSYTYNRDSKDYYISKTFFSSTDVITEFGPANPSNSLSLAATLYFQNGGSMIRLIQMDATNDWNRAFEQLERVETNYILPLTTIDTIPDGDGSAIPTQQQYLNNVQLLTEGLQHCKKMSSLLEKKERTIWGSNLRGRDLDGMIFDAQNLRHKRAVYIGPTTCNKDFVDTNTLTRSTVELDGCYVAAAALGLRLGQPDIATALTRKTLVGFKSIGGEYLSEIEKDLLGGNGVFLVVPPEENAVRFQVRHSVTTDPTNALKSEQSIVDIGDYIGKTTRDSLDALFIGRKLLTAAVTDIKQAVKEILDAAVSSNIITAVRDIVVLRDEREPRTINVRFQVSPVFPINWIKINFSLTR